MAVLFPSFVHELLVFLTKGFVEYGEKIVPLILYAKQNVFVYRWRNFVQVITRHIPTEEKTQLFVNHWHMELRNKKFSSEDSDICTDHHKTHANKGEKTHVAS